MGSAMLVATAQPCAVTGSSSSNTLHIVLNPVLLR
jgi:hypothetical protein